MNEILKALKEEITRVYSAKTLDALLPPIIFVIAQGRFNLLKALILAIALALILAIYRIYKGQSFIYAFAGVLGVTLAGGYAYYVGNSTSFFLSKLLGSALGAVLSFVSILFGRPLAAYLSHLSRGWPLKWFWRKDIKPAYREVTFAWGLLFSARLFLLYGAYSDENLSALLWISTFLGTPSTIIVLLLTYIYGTIRLKNLAGPGVEEFIEGKTAPWKGQTRGF